MQTIIKLGTQAATVAALGLIFLAYQYETIGSGLNPFIALPVATLAFMLPYLFRFPEEPNQ